MSEITFYAYDIDTEIAEMEDRLRDLLSQSSDEELKQATGGAIARIPNVSGRDWALSTFQQIFKAPVEDFNRGLKLVALDKNYWVEFSDDEGADRYLKGLDDLDAINTLQFLGTLLCRLHHCPKEKLPFAAAQGQQRLQSKFEIFGRVFSLYGSDYRKLGEEYCDLLAYALLSLDLLALYSHEHRPEDLSTALKINDMLLTTAPILQASLDFFAILAALKEGVNQVEAFYGREGFRLPAHQ